MLRVPGAAQGGQDESWSYTLEPEDETSGGKMVLALHGRGAPPAVDTFVPRALEYGTGERSQRTAVRRGIAAVVVCGT